MKSNLSRRLRSRRLAMGLLICTAALAALGTLPLPPAARARLGELPGILAAARAVGLVDTYHSPLFLVLAAALCVNVSLCTWERAVRRCAAVASAPPANRTGARRVLDALVHFALLAIVAGGVAKGQLGFVRTKNIYVGESADTFYDFGIAAEVPLGLTLEVLERVDTYYPLRALIGVSDRGSGRKVDLLEVREGSTAELTGGDLALTAGKPDPEAKKLGFRTLTEGRAGTVELSVVPGQEQSSADVGRYRLTLVAWQRELENVLSRVACLENGARVREGWISSRGRLACRGVHFAQTAYGSDDSGRPYVGIQAVREPGAPLFWVGCVALVLALPLFLATRARERRGAGSGETVAGTSEEGVEERREDRDLEADRQERQERQDDEDRREHVPLA